MTTYQAAGTRKAQVAALIRGLILSGELSPGDAVPSEHELRDRTGFSRETVRGALASLVAEGLIGKPIDAGSTSRHVVLSRDLLNIRLTASESRQRGKEIRPRGVDRFMADVSDAGREGRQEISVRIQAPTARIRELLQLTDPDAQVAARTRDRFVDGQQFDVCTSYYPLQMVEGTEIIRAHDIKEGVITYMAETLGIIQARYVDEIEGRMPTPDEARVLGIPQTGSPLLVHTRTSYDTEGKPVRVTVTTYAASRTRLIAEQAA